MDFRKHFKGNDFQQNINIFNQDQPIDQALKIVVPKFPSGFRKVQRKDQQKNYVLCM